MAGLIVRNPPTVKELKKRFKELPIGRAPAWAVTAMDAILAEMVEQMERDPEKDEDNSFFKHLTRSMSTAFFLGVVAEKEGWDTDIRGVGPVEEMS